jgi:hypothetical protein
MYLDYSNVDSGAILNEPLQTETQDKQNSLGRKRERHIL